MFGTFEIQIQVTTDYTLYCTLFAVFHANASYRVLIWTAGAYVAYLAFKDMGLEEIGACRMEIPHWDLGAKAR